MIITRLFDKLRRYPGRLLQEIQSCRESQSRELRELRLGLSLLYYDETMRSQRYSDEARLLKFGYKVYSQHDEDGIIQEIFRRIGTTSRTFLEIGTGNGLENNTVNLLIQGWSGIWIEGSILLVDEIRSRFDSYVTAENVNSVLRSELEKGFGEGKPRLTESSLLAESSDAAIELDLLSIDIDGNDCWVWQALTVVRPRVVVIEYNATLRAECPLAMPYLPDYRWTGTNYFGASLKSLEIIARRLGYLLVGCNFTGVNAFFVREDLVGNHFQAPYCAENHYEPPRYNILFSGGHPPGIGQFEIVV